MQITLSDQEVDAEKYVVLEKFLVFDDYEIANGMNTYYFEMHGTGCMCYHPFQKITIKKNLIQFDMDPAKISVVEKICVDISDVNLDADFICALRQITI